MVKNVRLSPFAAMLLGLLLVAACKTSVPREGARCDVDEHALGCKDDMLFGCRPRTGIWHFEAKCGGPAGCSVKPGTETEGWSSKCDLRAGDACGYAYMAPMCSVDGTAAFECEGDQCEAFDPKNGGPPIKSCKSGKLRRTECPKGCEWGRCK